MSPGKRVAVAAIALSRIVKAEVSAVFDYSTSRYYSFSIRTELANIHVFDYARSGYVSGGASGVGSYNLYDYPSGFYLSMQIKANGFSGFDFETSTHFSGTVTGRTVSLFDNQHSAYYNYSA